MTGREVLTRGRKMIEILPVHQVHALALVQSAVGASQTSGRCVVCLQFLLELMQLSRKVHYFFRLRSPFAYGLRPEASITSGASVIAGLHNHWLAGIGRKYTAIRTRFMSLE